MRNIKMLTGLLVLLAAYAGCKKDSGYHSYENQLKSYDGNTYDFLKEQHQYDSFLLAVDRVNLGDSLREGAYTVFAPADASFKQAIDNMNTLRGIQDRPQMYINTIPIEELDSLVSRYIVRGVIRADSMLFQDGLTMPAVRYGYLMHGKLNYTDAEGHVKGGPGVIKYSDTKGVIYTNRWSSANTMAIDIRTTNGMVNILEKDHMFGFDEFIRRMNPTHSTPYNEFPFFIPGVIGLEQYDRGGARVAYQDHSQANYGGLRPTEWVDVTNAEENGVKVGWTEADEWLKYTVDITETGAYTVILRYSSPNNDGRIHLELDDQPLIGSYLIMPGSGGFNQFRDITATVNLTAGRHVLKLYEDFANYDLRFLKFLPKDRPMPIPGLITLEDYMPGGEGVAYHDNNTGNNGGKYRPDEGVDIDLTRGEGGGYHIGWMDTGEWMKYSVDVKETGFYNIYTRAGTPNNNRKFRIEFNGENKTGTVVLKNTGDYSKWADNITTVHLEKGVQEMRFYVEDGGYDVKNVTIRRLN
jgi:uncharacterized surface protein with fasciclin (FAS1) repeats